MMTNRLLIRASQQCGSATTSTTGARQYTIIKAKISRRLLCAMAFTTTALSSSYANGFTPPRSVTKSNSKLLHKPSRVNGATGSRPHYHFHRPMLSSISSSSSLFSSSSFSTDAKMTKDEKEMTKDALAIIQEAISAVDPQTAVNNYVQASSKGALQFGGSSSPYHVEDYDNILILAFGKASSAMAKATVEKVHLGFGGSISISGVVIVKDDHATKEELDCLRNKAPNVQVREASHPVPDDRSYQAAQEIMSMASDATDRTLVLCCISGGGSALFCHPYSQFLSLDDLKQVNQSLLSSGMTINEMNVIRKRLEDGKGGRLAATAYPATVVSLVLSDILGDPLDLIASGPTVPDSSTFSDAYQLIQKYKLQKDLPDKVSNMIQMGMDGKLDDTPSENHPVFSTNTDNEKNKRCETVLVGNNELAVTAAAIEAEKRGYHPIVLGTRIEGEAKYVAGMYVAMAQHLVASKEKKAAMAPDAVAAHFTMSPLPVALIGGGETTVTLGSQHGKGGRNQELALAAALQLKSLSLRNVILASAGTDGTDGPTDAAGAVVDGGLVDRMPLSAEEYLQNHNAYNYFCNPNDTGDSNDGSNSPLIMTGPTGTNVADVCVTLVR